MPNIPRTGASGEIDFNGDLKTPHGRPSPKAGPQEHGERSPSHGAGGGYESDPSSGGASPTKIRLGETGGGSKFDPRVG